jgi:hypothetical protein
LYRRALYLVKILFLLINDFRETHRMYHLGSIRWTTDGLYQSGIKGYYGYGDYFG